MNIHEFRKNYLHPLRQATLCFLIDKNKVLLGMKKHGFAEDKWDGFGGKVNENILDHEVSFLKSLDD